MARVAPEARSRVDLLISLARELFQLHRARTRPGAAQGEGSIASFIRNLADHPRYSSLAPVTPQHLRELRHAYEAQGDQLAEFLREFGSTKGLAVARLPGAGKILRTHRLVTSRGQFRRVADVTLGDLRLLIASIQKKEGVKRHVKDPGPVFRIPEDLERLLRELEHRLKSLWPTDPEGRPRADVRPLGASSRRKLARLQALLEVFLRVTEITIEGGEKEAFAGPDQGESRPGGRRGLVVRDDILLGHLEQVTRRHLRDRQGQGK